MKVRIIALSGFLGAGKTTTMSALGRLLEQSGERVALITNDQGSDLVDTRSVAMAATVTDEVTGGCFCCRFEDLAAIIDQIVEQNDVTTIIMEAVGSCTDLQSTVIRPLRMLHGREVEVAPLVAVFDTQRDREFGTPPGAEPASDLAYLFDRQLAEADIIALNKIDQLGAVETKEVADSLSDRWPHARVVAYSAISGVGLPELVSALREGTSPRDTDLDYDRYAAAESALAWLNQSVDITSRPGGNGLMGATWAMTLLDSITNQCTDADSLVGHVKVRLDTPEGSVTANLVGRGAPAMATELRGRARGAKALINARVATTPVELDTIVRKAIALADEAAGALSSTTSEALAFSPSYPVPVHRVLASSANVGEPG